jgi:2-methylcitrate dehydratase PrpD
MADTPTAVQRLAAFTVDARTSVPDEVMASVRQRVLDVLGLQLAAAALETSRAAVRFVEDQGGIGAAHAVGLEGPAPAPWAAFVGGVLAHSLDYDDTHLPSILHPSASVIPAAMAAAEHAGATGAQTCRAVAAGLEVVIRLGMAGYDRKAHNSTFFEHGQHATSICGAVGSAAAAAALLGHGTAQVADAMGIAVSMAGGVIEANRTGGTVKRLHCGWAAHAGVSAALLAEAGFTGPPTVLEGRFGFFEAFLHGRYEPSELVEGLGERWAVPGIFFKPYPANHFTHTAIDAAIELRDQGLRPEDVEKAELGVASPTVRTIGEPLAGKQAPESGYAAQFSGPYVVASALLGGSGLGLGLDDFTDALARDPARRSLMSRINVAADERCDEIYPQQFPAVLRVRTKRGQHLEARVDVNRGGPDRPLSDEELATKFRDNACRWIDGVVAERVERLVHALDDTSPIGRLTEALPVGLPPAKSSG